MTALAMSYTPTEDGGVTIKVINPGTNAEYVALPYSHDDALRTAAHILRAAGVREARYSDGHLEVRL
jgi:hypothetical protein